jgi:hypothetical protein
MRNPAQVLAMLRTNPKTACAAWGFICRGAMLNGPVGGGCTLTCTISNGVYKLGVNAGAGDWFIPFAAGAARYCDVPRGQPVAIKAVPSAVWFAISKWAKDHNVLEWWQRGLAYSLGQLAASEKDSNGKTGYPRPTITVRGG